MPRRLSELDKLASPLPDGGYLCNYPYCLTKTKHSHCRCGMPRANGSLCQACLLELKGQRLSVGVDSYSFLMGFARAIAVSRAER